MLTGIVPNGIHDMPVERYIRRAWAMLPPHALRDAFKRRDVKINGARVRADAPVAQGDRIQIFLPDAFLPEPIQTVFNDGHLLACVKPQGLPVDVDSDGIGEDTLLTRIRKIAPDAMLCHRLDAQTGGIVLAAADSNTLRRAEETFKQHALQKTYLAIAKGGFKKREEVLNGYLVKNARESLVRVSLKSVPNAKEIQTRYCVIADDGMLAYLELEPITGRTHQLRAHMAFIQHPLIGDDKYGSRNLNRDIGGGLRLWCASVRIAPNSPLTEYRSQIFTAPKPDWWEI